MSKEPEKAKLASISKSVDDFIDDLHSDPYASWVLNHFRLPAMLRARFDLFMAKHKLFCSREGIRYRCTGASRLGDVWLTRDFNQHTGYQLRVDITQCSKWGDKP